MKELYITYHFDDDDYNDDNDDKGEVNDVDVQCMCSVREGGKAR